MKKSTNLISVMETRNHFKNGASLKSLMSRGNVYIITLYILFLSPFLSSMSAQSTSNNPSVTIVNNTGYTVYRVYISPVASDSWGDDRLASNQTLSNGQSVSLRLPHPTNVVNRYDIKLVDKDGDSYTKTNVLVSSNSRIEFTFGDFSSNDSSSSSNTSTTTYNGPSITIVNNTGYTVFNVYISQTASESWGEDRLGAFQVLANGENISLRLPYPTNVVNRYDIRLKDSDEDTYTKLNVLVSANSRIEFTFDDYD